ncbi:hypothetical protein PMIN01_02365 [Paraphaeosphaeria minitans]|uniref:Uncharacterized protein n=1 Tax=Paraphaeosphaeria minitans TaxID=565426 RepID=A0A9P6GQ18_9PLEO|nr:hypothetical protein PMIN01_02365 [Paraphaeosphaeria minitans]
MHFGSLAPSPSVPTAASLHRHCTKRVISLALSRLTPRPSLLHRPSRARDIVTHSSPALSDNAAHTTSPPESTQPPR